MAFPAIDNTRVNAAKHQDDWYAAEVVAGKEVPYASIQAAKDAIPAAVRMKGRSFIVTINGVTEEYWWKDDLVEPIPKQTDKLVKSDTSIDTKNGLPYKRLTSVNNTDGYIDELPIGFGKRVVIIGSSTWDNIGATAGNGLGAKITADLVAKGYTVFNEAIGGNTTALNMARFFNDVKALKPDIVLLANSITNELLALGVDAAYSSFTQNTLTMVRECQRIGAKVAVYGTFAFDGFTSDGYKMARNTEHFFAKYGIRTLTSFNNTANPDNNGHWWPAFSTDGTHGNDAGCQAQYEAISPDWAETLISGKTIASLDGKNFYWKANTAGAIYLSSSKPFKSFTSHGFFKGVFSGTVNTLIFLTNGADNIRITQDVNGINLLVANETPQILGQLINNDRFFSVGLTCTYTGTNQVFRVYIDGELKLTYTATNIYSLYLNSYMARNDLTFPFVNGSIAIPYFSRVPLFQDEMVQLSSGSIVRNGMLFTSSLEESPGKFASNKAESVIIVYILGVFTRGGTYEINLNDLQPKTDSGLNTTNKTVVGAINEVNNLTINTTTKKTALVTPTVGATSVTIPALINQFVNFVVKSGIVYLVAASANEDDLTVSFNSVTGSITFASPFMAGEKLWANYQGVTGGTATGNIITVQNYSDITIHSTWGGSAKTEYYVLTDNQNMGGKKGAYVYIPNFTPTPAQIAINFND